MTEVYLNRIETSVPPSDGHARYVEFLPNMIRDERLLKIVQRLASKCQIESRHSVLLPASGNEQLDTDGFFAPGKFASTARRMRRYREEALPLARRALDPLLESVARDSITHVIVTSCTGFYAPGLDLEIQRTYGLRGDVERSIIGFMGCYAAINGMRAAYHAIRSEPGARVLLVNLELCSLHLQDSGDPEKILGSLQFADGCAASLLSADPVGLRLERFRSETLADRVGLIEWNVGDTGFEMFLSPEVPKALAQALPQVFPQVMSGAERAQMKLWAVHPGGRSIIDAVQTALELKDSELAHSRKVLRENGNMSSATIMFVLKAMLENSAERGPGIAMAFGPGLTVETMLFEKGSA
jgi:alpha-pyrone synthase